MMLGYHLTKFSKNAPIPILGHTQSPGRLILCFPHWTTQRRLSVKGRIKKGPINLWPIILPTLICITKKEKQLCKENSFGLGLENQENQVPPINLGPITGSVSPYQGGGDTYKCLASRRSTVLYKNVFLTLSQSVLQWILCKSYK